MLKRFSIWLDSKTLAELKKIALREERPLGWLIRKAVEDFVAKSKEKP
jgi:predicted transcriptional regulator